MTLCVATRESLTLSTPERFTCEIGVFRRCMPGKALRNIYFYACVRAHAFERAFLRRTRFAKGNAIFFLFSRTFSFHFFIICFWFFSCWGKKLSRIFMRLKSEEECLFYFPLDNKSVNIKACSLHTTRHSQNRKKK